MIHHGASGLRNPLNSFAVYYDYLYDDRDVEGMHAPHDVYVLGRVKGRFAPPYICLEYAKTLAAGNRSSVF